MGVVLLCAAAVLAATLLATTMPVYLGLNIVFYIFNSMYLPLMQALAIEGDPTGHGMVSGLFQSFKSLGAMVGALVAGFIYEASPLAPFVMAAVAFAGGATRCWSRAAWRAGGDAPRAGRRHAGRAWTRRAGEAFDAACCRGRWDLRRQPCANQILVQCVFPDERPILTLCKCNLANYG